MVALALPTPVTQRLLQNAKAVGDRAALTDQLQRLPPERLRIGRPRLRHRCPSLPRRFRRKCSGLRNIGGITLLDDSVALVSLDDTLAMLSAYPHWLACVAMARRAGPS